MFVELASNDEQEIFTSCLQGEIFLSVQISEKINVSFAKNWIFIHRNFTDSKTDFFWLLLFCFHHARMASHTKGKHAFFTIKGKKVLLSIFDFLKISN